MNTNFLGTGLLRSATLLISTLVLSSATSLAHYFGPLFLATHWGAIIAVFPVALGIGILLQSVWARYIYWRDRRAGRWVLYKLGPNPFLQLVLVFGVLMIVWAIPAWIIYSVLQPEYPKRALKISVFLLTTGSGILYYIHNKEKLPSIADKITYFSGVTLGPVGVIEIIL